MGYCRRIFTPAQPVYPAASLRDFLSGALTFAVYEAKHIPEYFESSPLGRLYAAKGAVSLEGV
jgi:hypothetical protein